MNTSTSENKLQNLFGKIDWSRPELAEVKSSADPAQALVNALRRPPRGRYRFEYDAKTQMLAFLEEHYQTWREFDLSAADKYVAMTTKEAADGFRSTTGIAALGQAWWATGDPRYGETFQRFYLETETGEMFSWGSFTGAQPSIELAAYFLLLDCPGFETVGHVAFLDHLLLATERAWDEHTSQWKQTMLGPEGHNWYLHGMHCLPSVGLLFPEFIRSKGFVKSGWSIVEEHVRGHYRSDGGARETSIGYQVGSLRDLWDHYQMAQRNGWPVSPGFAEGVLCATKFLLRLATPRGGTPSFGDGHGGPGALTSLAAMAAALSGDGECKWYAEQFHGELEKEKTQTPGVLPYCAFWQVGLAGARTYEQTRSRDPQQVSVLMPQTGYAALRDSGEPSGNYMAIAAANRGPIVTSHGHNDILAFEVHAHGEAFLGEPGCAPYGNSPGRDYDQCTRAHNTLTIASQEQVDLINEWRWKQHISPVVWRWMVEENFDFFHGVHEGFNRLPDQQVIHARKVLFLKSDPVAWLVFDWIEAEDEQDYEIWWHGLAPGKIEGNAIRLRGEKGTELLIAPPQEDNLIPEAASEEGLDAYRKERKIDPEKHPVFAYRHRCGAHCFVWLIAPVESGQTPTLHRVNATLDGTPETGNGATAVELLQGETVTKVVLSHHEFDSRIEFDGREDWGNLIVERSGENGFRTVATVADGVAGR